MPSQFFGLNIAYTGLLASNAALNTTSNNIANVQTEGYSRQQVKQQAYDALRVFQTYGCAGAGVETIAIERIRDEFYDGRYWDNNAKFGEYDIKQYYMKQVESYFDDNGKNAGFKTVFDHLMITGMQALLKNPGDTAAKSQFVGYAGDLTEYFNGLAGNLEKLQSDVNQEIKIKVDEINSLAGEIATLNKQINTIELGGPKANELRDRRSLLLDQLSEIVDIETLEIPMIDTNDPDRETGGNRFIVKIAGGQVLVDTNEYRGLHCEARTSYEKVHQTDIDGLYDVYWDDGQQFNLYNAAMEGNLKGLVEMRDGNNAENFYGNVIDIGTKTVDGDTRDTVTVEVTKAYLQDLNRSNLSDQGGKINLGNQEFYYDAWEYKCSYDDNGNAVYTYTFTLSGSDKNKTRLTNDRVGKPAEIGADIAYQGIPYYMNQMNEWVRTFSQKFNDILTSGYSSSDTKGIIMFTGDMATTDAQLEFTDEFRYDQQKQKYQAAYEAEVDRLKKEYMDNDPNLTEEDALAQAQKEAPKNIDAALREITVTASDSSYYRLTAKNYSILASMVQDPRLMANKFKQGDGVEQDDLLKAIDRMVYDKDQMSFRAASASEFLQCILSDVALNASRANKFQQSFKDIAGVIDTQRMSISGVDEDEEAVNLVKYQNGYNLASKMIQVLTEVYDRLILQTGV